jgi:hypothetical protein
MAMVLVICGLLMVSLLATYLIDRTMDEQSRSSTARTRDAAFQAAEAGVDDYIAKLVADSAYYLHRVHPGEATRRDTSSGTTVSAGAPTSQGATWNLGITWTYPNGYDQWRTLANGYQYSLEIVPPGPGSQIITVYSTGRPNGSATTTDWRTVEVQVRPSSIADFQRVVDLDVSVGADTYGKYYANGSITHTGHAYANLYAKNTVTVDGDTLQSGVQKYDKNTNPSFSSVFPTPINFNNLLASIVDVQRAASIGGYSFDDASKAAWKITFKSNGTFDIASCSQGSGTTSPVCGAATNKAVPSNGAIYTGQTAIVSGTVNGRVTVASNDNIIISNNIDYADGGNGKYGSTGWQAHANNADDVLGLVAKNDVIVASYAPGALTWTAAVIAQSGTWYGAGNMHSGSCPDPLPGDDPAKSCMHWTGSSTTKDGGSFADQYYQRDYGYDPALLYLPPPWFPQLQDSYTTALFRELPPGTQAS